MKKLIFLLVVWFSTPAFAGGVDYNCKRATLEDTLNCLLSEYNSANRELELVLSTIKVERSDDELFISGFNKAQSDWEASFRSNCASIYNLWRYGSVKNIKWLECKIGLTKQRITFLSNNYVVLAEGA